MKIDESIINEVREQNDIVDVIGSYINLKKKGSSYFGLCPFHNEKTPSFSVDPRKQIYKCFGGCGAAGNVFGFVMKYENFSFPEAVKMLAERVGIEIPEQKMTEADKRRENLREQLLEINRLAGIFYYNSLMSDKGKLAYKYLTDRGLKDETIKSFGLGYADKQSDSLYKHMKAKGYKDEVLKQSGLFTFDEKHGANDKFWNRVMFPIMDRYGKIVAFGGRVMGDAMPKYLNSPETPIFHKGRTIYALNKARSTRKPYLILCEGYMDVISLHQAGFNNAVAALGTAFTDTHAAELKKVRIKDVILSFDSDDAGRNAAVRTIPYLRNYDFKVKVLDMSPYKDPDELIKAMGPEEYDKRVSEASNYFIFQVRQVQKKYDMNEPQEKTDFYNEIAYMLLGFEDALERKNYLEAVALEFGIDKAGLESLVKHNAIGYVPKKENNPEKPFISKEKRIKLASQAAQSYVISILCDYPSAYSQIKTVLSPEDFIDASHIKAVELLYKQLEEGKANPSVIIDQFADSEDLEIISNLFMPPKEVDVETTDVNRIVTDAVKRIKTESIELKLNSKTMNDPAVLMQTMKEKKEIDNISIKL